MHPRKPAGRLTVPCRLRINPQGEAYLMERPRLLSILMLVLLVTPAWATDVTGTWRVTISTSEGAITGKASLKQSGDTVTGWIGPSEDDPIPVNGTVRGTRLTIKTSPQPGRTVAFDKCDVAIDGDKMTGTIDTDKGKIEFARSSPN